MKREFLVKDKKIQNYLQENSLTCKLYRYKNKNSYMYEFSNHSFVLEEYEEYKKLILISKEDIVLDSAIQKLEEITDNIRYSKEYLELFGNPKKYEFDEKRVFEKCDSLGLSRLDLHFKDGMSSAKVFKVVLYRLNQIFTLKYEMYIKKEIEHAELKKSYKKLQKTLKLSKKVFDKKIVKHIKNDLENLYMLLSHQSTFERYVLNFQMFINENDFYKIKDSDKPIHFFSKKNELTKLGIYL